jgi:hypothetical protein
MSTPSSLRAEAQLVQNRWMTTTLLAAPSAAALIAAAPADRKAMSTDILHFRVRVLVIQAVRGWQ